MAILVETKTNCSSMSKIIFFCHETDEAVETKLKKHLATYKDFDFYSNLTPIIGEDILNIKAELTLAHVVVVVLSVDFMYDSFLSKLWKRAVIKKNETEIVQVLARSVLLENIIISGITTIPDTPLSTHKDPDAAYIFVVQIIIDKVEIALLKKKIKDLESILHTRD